MMRGKATAGPVVLIPTATPDPLTLGRSRGTLRDRSDHLIVGLHSDEVDVIERAAQTEKMAGGIAEARVEVAALHVDDFGNLGRSATLDAAITHAD